MEKARLKSSKNPKGKYHEPRSHGKINITYSTAPYNFIPLNDRVIEAESKPPTFDRYHGDKYTGYIDLTIETLTPLYIRDTLTMDEFKLREQYEKEEKTFINPDFFSPGGLIRIPGSSIRGMIRTLLEIVSFGKFEFFDDRRLYYRFFADRKKELRDYYRSQTKDIKAGVLIKKGYRNYVIKETGFKQEKDTSRQEEIISPRERENEGWNIYSGMMSNKKHNWFIYKPENNARELTIDYNRVIKPYLDDSTRRSKINLIEWLEEKKEFSEGIPCFYVLDETGRVRAIGHTRYLRMAYNKTIGNCVRQKNTEVTDLVNAIFGDEKTRAGRVFFEDALPAGSVEFYEEAYPKILSSPKPTCIQHYLTQSDPEGKILHYDNASSIRGYKLYWHRDGKDWIETDTKNIDDHKTQYTRIKPVKEGVKFRGRIRFENLSKVELGALLFVLDLPEGCAHKLGMAKPLGLGSIKITPALYLSDRQKRYRELFAEWDSLTDATQKINEFKKTFEEYILNALCEKNKTTIWELERLKELKIMLHWKNKPHNSKTSYLKLEDFKHRHVLPKPSEIIKE